MNLEKKVSLLKKNIANAVQACSRNPSDISFIAVTKYATIAQLEEAYRLGIRDFGESKVQQALPRIEKLPANIRWHFIGKLQKNKVSKVIGKFYLIHSVDSAELAEKISLVSQEKGVITSVLLQVNTSEEKSKGGIYLEYLDELFEHVIQLPNMVIQGLMTIGPLTEDKKRIRKSFEDLSKAKIHLEEKGYKLPILSMGMTHDYPLAIAEGATLLRIGSALFGHLN